MRLYLYLFLTAALVLTACDQMPDMPRTMRQAISGNWQQTDGKASLYFYTDATVMVKLPARTPPLNFLSSYNLMKNGHISIETGNVWQGAIICTWKEGGKTMRVNFPDKAKMEMQFIKSNNKSPLNLHHNL